MCGRRNISFKGFVGRITLDSIIIAMFDLLGKRFPAKEDKRKKSKYLEAISWHYILSIVLEYNTN